MMSSTRILIVACMVVFAVATLSMAMPFHRPYPMYRPSYPMYRPSPYMGGFGGPMYGKSKSNLIISNPFVTNY